MTIPASAAASAAAPAATRAAAPGAPNPSDLADLLSALLTRNALLELAVLALCLGGAWAMVRLLRGTAATPDSVWFGERIVDGVLFPVLALLLALAARWGLADMLPIAVFKLAVPILLSLLVIRLTVRVLHRAFPSSQLVRVIERSVSWLAWITVVLWLTGLLPLLMAELDTLQWQMGGSRVSLLTLLQGALSVVVVMVVALWISAALEARLLEGAAPGGGGDLSMRKIAANALRALLLFVGLMVALTSAGIDLTALGVLGGAVGVGIGLGLQKLAANYVSGFVILAENSMRIGDIVKVDNFEGRITDISTRYTVIRAFDGRESVVPNEMMITQRVENLSLADPRVMIASSISVAYGTDVEVLIPKLVEVMKTVPRVLHDPEPGVGLFAFGADGLELRLICWIADPINGLGNVRSDINRAVLRAIQAWGVEIPFPQRVVHVTGGARLPEGGA
jgi:small-conductance mechanosensitive channel